MELLKAEIERKRKATAALIDDVNPGGKIGNTRFVRQSDLMSQRQREQAAAQEESDRNNKRRKVATAEAAATAHAASTSAAAAATALTTKGGGSTAAAAALKAGYTSLTLQEVKNRLRNGGHPITLFGESKEDRVSRLRLIELNAVEEGDFMLTAASGHSNNPRAGETAAQRAVAQAGDEEEEDVDEDDEDDRKAGREAALYIFEPTHFTDDKKLPKRKVIYKYFRYLLKCWEYDLNQRPDHDKTLAKGKMETRTQKQCKDYIRYLFKLCKKDDVPFDIEHKLHLVSTASFLLFSFVIISP
jgi:pre-mRNA-splicing factor 18